MKLVKISDLSEEERKKAFEEQQKRLEENRRISEQNRVNANNQFNELINRTGAFDTNNHTTNFYNITNAMKSSGASKQSISGFKKSNHISLWDSVLDIMNGTGKAVENTWLGLNNGIKSFQQTIGTRISETQERQIKTFNEWEKKTAEKTIQENPIKGKVLLEQKPLISEEQIKSENNENIKKIQNKKQINEEKINKNIEEIKNPAMKKIAEISPSIGQMIPAFASGGIGAVYMAGSSTGQYYDDAKQRGMSDEEAKTYSGIMGLMEGTTEMIGINSLSKAGKGLKEIVKGTGKKVAKETAEEVSKSTVKEVLKDYGIGIADNVIQEAVIDPIQEFTAQTVAGKDKAQWEGIGQKMLQDGINGGLVSAILGGTNLGIQSCTGIVEKMQNNENVTQQELQTAVKDAGQQLDIPRMMMDSVEQQVNKYKNYYTGKESDSNTQDVLKQAQNIINNNQNSQQKLTQNQFNSQEQQIKNAPDSNIVENTTKIKGYHGTDENFDNFDLKYFGKHDQGDFGKAVYFSDNENTASKYGKNVKQQDIELNNPYIINTKEDYKQLWSQLAKETDISKLDKTELKLLKDPYTSQEEKNFMLYDKLNSEEKANAIQKLGYDGVIDNTYGQIAVFDTDKINNIVNNQKTLNNTTPKTAIKEFNESAKQYNIDYQNEDLKEIKQMFDKRGIKAYFDYNTFRNNNEAFSVWKPTYDEQGNVSGREVVFNPKAQDTNTRVQELAIHELGHDLDLNEVQNMILKDASKKENWEVARKSLENTYKQAYENDGIQISKDNFNKIVDEEATMSILQRELGNQEYVNRLVNQNQSIAKKIYNWVVDKLNKFTGGKNEKLFWTDIRNKFETAYNQEFSKNDTIAKYSIAGEKSLENIKNDGYLYTRGMDAYNTAINMSKQNMDNEQIRQKTGWFQDKNGDWKYEFSDKDMELKNTKLQPNKTYKLENILKHDTLFALYPEIKNYKVEVVDNIKANGVFDRRNNIITINSKLIKNTKSFEGTLIHEIQHGIQNIENFEKGASTKGGKLKYYNSLGEIEATETKERFLAEKYQNKDMTKIAPESSKENPQHKNLNRYLKNRKLLDKIKDGLYNYLNKKGRSNYENFEEMVEENSTQNNSLVDGRKRRRYVNEEVEGLGDSNEGYQETNQENIRQNNRVMDDEEKGRVVESENNSGSFNLQENKKKQLDIIEKNNKMQDDYHTGIRKIEDIKTLAETLEDSDWQGYEEFNPDYTKKMADEALKTGKITVYSSYPIEQGVFVSPSKMEAESYSGNGKVYSKEININDVAWIDPTQGQYANTNQKYALATKDWQKFLENNYQKQGDGKNLKEYNLPTREEVKKKLNLPTKENVNTQGESINWNEIERPERKIRKHYKSIIESSNTTKEAKSVAKELMGVDTYVPETNKGQLEQADYRINNSSPESELKSLMSRAIQGEKINSVDIAVGERLIQYYSKTGDKKNLQEAIQATAMAGTSAGQTVQALAMLNHQTPQGQATWIQRSVDKMNIELAKKKGGVIKKDEAGNIKVINKDGKDITDKVNLFNLTSDMLEKIIKSANKNEMYQNIDLVYEELGQQVPLSTIEKIDSWRYFSMLANPKTHIRNMLGNFAMGKTQEIKNKLAGAIEDIVGTFNKDMERTKTLRFADKKTKQFAKEDVLNPDVQSMIELNENKYNPQSRLQNARKTFKNDMLENTLGRLFNWNDKLLEAEDAIGLKSNYKKALENYLVANKIDVDNITDAQLNKARSYAVEQAKEATFHQANAIATAINQISNRNKVAKGIKDATLPFVKTPLNVAKAGVEYNPIGLLKAIVYDSVKLRKGEITVNKYIDNLAKGLTGTGVAVLGYALADGGILKASGSDDDKKEKYDEELGNQTYSIKIGDKTYSLDWLSPVGIPLFVGAELKALKDSRAKENNSISTDDDEKFNQVVKSFENLANAMANSISPMSEMSMISGLTSALKSYDQDSTKMLATMGTNAIKSYVNQFVPTILGQMARTTDDYERTTTSTKTGVLTKAIDQTKLQVMSKIPGLRQKLPTKSDIWGAEKQSDPNMSARIINNFINPATVKDVNVSEVDKELNNLYDKIGESSILPSSIEKTYKINGQTYRMTNKEFSEYKKRYGQTSYKLLNDLIKTKEYEGLSDKQKQKAIESIYEYAKEANKIKYAKENNLKVKTDTLYKTLDELKQKGGNQSAYLTYLAKTNDIGGEDSSKKKIQVLANLNCTDTTKEIIYKNTEGNKDKKIIVVDKLGLPINQYLRYKSQKFESDKDKDGETIKGSKNKKVYNYLNDIPDSELSQNYKKIIAKIEGINKYDNDIVNRINENSKLSPKDRVEILTRIGFKIDKNGKVQTKSIIPITKYVK